MRDWSQPLLWRLRPFLFLWWIHGLDDSYFIDDYSMINATEDRARIFEYAVENRGTLFRDAPGLIAKLQYYSDCIRDCFDTALWPEITAWEAPLH